jgi:hypothetical protein
MQIVQFPNLRFEKGFSALPKPSDEILPAAHQLFFFRPVPVRSFSPPTGTVLLFSLTPAMDYTR